MNNVKIWNPRLLDHAETHLAYTLWYVSADGRSRWTDGIVNWQPFDDPEIVIAYILKYQTDFVRTNWIRLEVNLPNRNKHGTIDPGWIKATGVLLAERN